MKLLIILTGLVALDGLFFFLGRRTGRKHAYNTALYLMAGAGSTKFAGDNHFTAVAGLGFRMLPNDWLAVHVDMRDHMFDTDLLGEKKTAHNFEAQIGLTVFF